MSSARETKPSFNKGSRRLRAGCQLLGSRIWTLIVGPNPSQLECSLTEPQDFLSCLLDACVQSVRGPFTSELPTSPFPSGSGFTSGWSLSIRRWVLTQLFRPHLGAVISLSHSARQFRNSCGGLKKQLEKAERIYYRKRETLMEKGKWVSSPVGSPAYRQELGPVCTVPDPL